MTTPSQKIIDAAWADESESRLNAFQTGKLTARPFDDVIKEMNTELWTGRADT